MRAPWLASDDPLTYPARTWIATATRRLEPFQPMILSVFRRRKGSATIDALYGAIVAQARLPSFYLAYGIADSRDGRFDLIVLHQVLLARRLSRDGEAGRAISQDVFDLFCRDMDANLREM